MSSQPCAAFIKHGHCGVDLGDRWLHRAWLAEPAELPGRIPAGSCVMGQRGWLAGERVVKMGRF